MRSELQLTSLASWGLLFAALVTGCRRDRAVDFALVEVAPAHLETWDQCLIGVGEAVNRLAISSARLGTVSLGDAGCEWITATSDGGSLIASRYKVFGTHLRFDATRGTTIAAQDLRVIGEKTTSAAESFEWHDDNGDGRRDMERRVTFGPEGEEQRLSRSTGTMRGCRMNEA